jgi:hypothetical protein
MLDDVKRAATGLAKGIACHANSLGLVAQLGERRTVHAEVAGSKPVEFAKFCRVNPGFLALTQGIGFLTSGALTMWVRLPPRQPEWTCNERNG